MVKSNKAVTLQDIATRLNISKVTVSKALRSHPDISDATTEKVKEMAASLDYRPNILARKLSARETRTIGLVVPKIAHHFLTQAIDSIYKVARTNDYEIVMMVSEEDADLERKHIETLMSMRVDGLLVSVTEKTVDATIFKQVAASGTPVIFFDRVIDNIGCSCITSADETGVFDLVNLAIAKGYKHFGHIGGYQTVSISRDRYKGFLRALESHDLSLRKEDVIFGGFSRSDGRAGFIKLMNRGNLPEILFAVTYPVALGILASSREYGVNIPLDLDLICFGGSNYNSLITPSITGITPPAEEIGRIALEQVLHQIQKPNDKTEKRIIVPVEVNLAETCVGPRRKGNS